MAKCKICGSGSLEWKKDMNGKWRLYEGVSFHDCHMTQEQYSALRAEANIRAVCKHGILKDRACDRCEDEL